MEHLASELELPLERVALRGEEVLQEIHFEQEEIRKDPLLVTPIGICISYYDQKNNFLFVRFNGERIKLYDNNKLTIVDAALRAGFPNEQLFPRRGKEINFYVNGKKRIVRGEPGESAVVRVNGRVTSINATLEANSDIVIEPSTVGAAAACRLEELEEYGRVVITFEVNGRMITCPKFAEVNGSLEPPYYEIQENDWVEMRSFYTVAQIMEFMDVEIDLDSEILVNNKPADLDTQVYENFSLEWEVITYRTPLEEIEGVYRQPQEELPAEESPEAATGLVAADSPDTGRQENEGAGQPEEAAKVSGTRKAAGTERAASARVTQAGDAATEETAKTAETGKADGKTGYSGLERVARRSQSTDAAPSPAGDHESSHAAGIAGQETGDVPAPAEALNTAVPEAEESQPEGQEAASSQPEGTPEPVIKESQQKGVRRQEKETEPQRERSGESKPADGAQEPQQAEPAGAKEGTTAASKRKLKLSQTEEKQDITQEELEEKFLQSQQTTESDIRPTIRKKAEEKPKAKPETPSLQVIVNNAAVTLRGKASYVFVDVFDAISFDLNAGKGRAIVTKLNGEIPSYTAPLKYGDVVEIYWED